MKISEHRIPSIAMVALTAVALAGCGSASSGQGDPDVGSSDAASASVSASAENRFESAKDVKESLEENGIECLDEDPTTSNGQSQAKCESQTLIVVSPDKSISDLYSAKYIEDGNAVLKGDNWFVMQNEGVDRLEAYESILGGELKKPAESGE